MTETETQTPPAAGSEPPAAPGKPKAHKTLYVLLCSVDGGTTWTVEGEQKASGKASALTHFYEARDVPTSEDGGVAEFQAIPLSSWKPLKPNEPRPRVPFSEAD